MSIRSFFSPRRWFRLAIAGLLCWLLLSILAVAALRFVPPPLSGFMAQRWIAGLVGRDDFVWLRYRWTSIDEVSANLPITLVAAEDQKFPIHHGFDIDAIRSAVNDAEDGERLRGASTISQQVAKNLFLWNGRSYLRKGIEAYYTVLIETLWPKRRIVEMYLNIAEFGDGIYGATAASNTYFGITPKQLSARQSALLAGVLPNPRKYRVAPASPYVQRRAGWIERQARQLGGADYLKPR
ncbi:MAG: monofunctional biosynthetic peptidoglycan transglycosylase [Dokdonella sp.]